MAAKTLYQPIIIKECWERLARGRPSIVYVNQQKVTQEAHQVLEQYLPTHQLTHQNTIGNPGTEGLTIYTLLPRFIPRLPLNSR